MRKSLQWTLVLTGLAALAMAPTAAAGGGHDGFPGPGRAEGGDAGGFAHAKGRPHRGHATLTPPEGAADEDARGVVRVRLFPAIGARAERSWFRVQVASLEANAEYTVWATNPDGGSVDQFGTLTTNDEGGGKLRLDTKKGHGLPFDATLETLAGGTIEVHDAAGATVLEGTIPAAE